MTWSAFRSKKNRIKGQRCPECYREKTRLTIEFIKAEVSRLEPGYTLLSDVYANNKTNLLFRCDKGHDPFSTCWGYFRNRKDGTRGSRCPKCARERTSHSVEFIRSEVLRIAPGYTLLSETYLNAHTHLRFRCDKGHEFLSEWNSFQDKNGQRGKRCAACAKYGFDPEKPAILYYVRFDRACESFYKIGITNQSVKGRFRFEKLPYTIISETPYLLGRLAYEEEQRTKNMRTRAIVC
jgi:hypothetical protein